MERNCRSNLRPQLGAGWERCWIDASIWIFLHARRLRLGSAFYGLPKTPWGIFCYSPTPPPCWESVFSGKPAHGHTVWTDCAARAFETSSADLDSPATQNRRRTQLPPPPPRTDSVSTTDQSQQTTAPDTGPEGQGTRRTGRSRSRGHHHGPVLSPPRQSYTSLQASGRSGGTSRRAPDWNPLANLANHRSGGWKKDLDFYMGAYFRLNYRNEPTSKWPALKAKFFNFLIDHHSEWKSIRNNDPLGYLPYMEAQFEQVTGYKLVGLGACTEWIRAGTYYHWVIAQRGELGRCPRLASTPPPEGPMTPPPFLPVTAAASPATVTPAAPAALPAPAAPPATATQAIAPKPPQGGGGRPRSKSQPRKRDAAAAGVQGAARDTGGAGDSSDRSG